LAIGEIAEVLGKTPEAVRKNLRLTSGTAAGTLVQAWTLAIVIGLFIWAWIDDQRQRSFVTGTRADRPASRITKISEAVCVQHAVSEWPSAARRRFRGGYHGV
jgi:hypothetical protein